MFEKKQDNNQILPFFFSENLPNNKLIDYVNFVDKEGFSVFVISSLTSNTITDLSKYLSIGLNEVEKRFKKTDLPILDRMKASIFQSGDFLANHLVESNEEVEDVDFSVCILSFKDNIAYVWIDGNLNIRIYRGDESLLVNGNAKPQFFGSTEVELGDIFSITFSELQNEDDADVENYVLEKAAPPYPVLLLDYQVDESIDSLPTANINAIPDDNIDPEMNLVSEDIDGDKETISLSEESSYSNRGYQKTPRPNKVRTPSFDIQGLLNKLKTLKDSPNTKKVISSIRSAGLAVYNFLLSITSRILDFIYVYILRRNNHQFKRFQTSHKKKNLQYLLIVVLIITPVYFIFLRTPAKKTTTNTTNTTKNSKNDEQLRASVQTAFQNLQQIYNTDPISPEVFNQSYTVLKQEIDKAKSAGFSDTVYLQTTLNEAQTYENKVLKVTPITKVDISYNATNIPNAKIVDFSVNGVDVYAIDQANAQVLKSGATQEFEVFAKDERAADKKLTSLTQIACSENLCYLLDESKGLAVLNLQDKSFSNYSGLSEAGKNVKEMIYYANVKKIYTLIPSTGKVLRYDKVGDAFTAATQWNKDAGFGADIVDIAIDGSVMELSSTGKLRRFASGVNDTQFTGLEPSTIKLGTRLQFVTSLNPNPARTNRLYIADSENKMIAVYEPVFKEDKSNAIIRYAFKGIYKYTGTDKVSFDNFQEITLSADENAFYVLDGNVVHKVTTTGV